jgi:hypothetical protein
MTGVFFKMIYIDEYLIKNYGYAKTVMMQEFITWSAGILLGIILGTLIISYILLNIRIDYDMTSASTVIKMNKNRNKWIIVNPKTVLQLLEVYYITVAWMLSKDKDEIKIDSFNLRRIRLIIIFVLMFSLILILIGIYLSVDILLPE